MAPPEDLHREDESAVDGSVPAALSSSEEANNGAHESIHQQEWTVSEPVTNVASAIPSATRERADGDVSIVKPSSQAIGNQDDPKRSSEQRASANARTFDVLGLIFALLAMICSATGLLWVARVGPFEITPPEGSISGVPTDRIWAELWYNCPESTRAQLRLDLSYQEDGRVFANVRIIIVESKDPKNTLTKDHFENYRYDFDASAAQACEGFSMHIMLPDGVTPNEPFSRKFIEPGEVAPNWARTEKADGPMRSWRLDFTGKHKDFLVRHGGFILSPTYWVARPISFSKRLLAADLVSSKSVSDDWDGVPQVAVELTIPSRLEVTKIVAQPKMTRYGDLETRHLILGAQAMYPRITVQDPGRKGTEDFFIVFLSGLLSVAAGAIYEALRHLITRR